MFGSFAKAIAVTVTISASNAAVVCDTVEPLADAFEPEKYMGRWYV